MFAGKQASEAIKTYTSFTLKSLHSQSFESIVLKTYPQKSWSLSWKISAMESCFNKVTRQIITILLKWNSGVRVFL